MKPKSKILIIAGSDSSGGAGIQADIKTITSLGSYAMTAITAVTTQNTQGVKSVIPIPSSGIKGQIIYTAQDIKPDAIKIGMLHSSQVVKTVISSLEKIKIRKILKIVLRNFFLIFKNCIMYCFQELICHAFQRGLQETQILFLRAPLLS